ncbi:MAG: molybdate ABC transporter substrate-binding protein, partial [Pseudomonadota bacterium]
FETLTGHTLTITSGSTGKLYGQIVNGAPFDVFLAADEARPHRLVAGGYAEADDRFTYATGRLVLLGLASDDPGKRLQDLDFSRLAMANPELAPYGLAARQVLTALGLGDLPAGKVALGESVGQAFAFLATGNADIGFIANAQLSMLPEDREWSSWPVPAALHDPIRQDGVLLSRGRDNAAARAFVDFIKGEQARALIAASGFSVE